MDYFNGSIIPARALDKKFNYIVNILDDKIQVDLTSKKLYYVSSGAKYMGELVKVLIEYFKSLIK